MRRVLIGMLLAAAAFPAVAREPVTASSPQSLSVTVYRDPNRGADDPLNRDWPRGFAMISETRTVTLPAGPSTVRFEGVAEGMVAVSAIVTGLPGGTIEKNRNADLLSPAALVDGTLGNRVTITRTNPATGKETSEAAIVRTRADGGLVLQTSEGFEAVRCSGVPERLAFDRVPQGLSASPVYSIDTNSAAGGTHTVTLTYLASGFDWQAHYVASVAPPTRGDTVKLALTSWLTVVNDNGQSFPQAELLAVAGRLRVQSDYQSLSDPPDARPLELVCYPLGSTAAGSREDYGLPMPAMLPSPPPPPSAPMEAVSAEIMVTGSRMRRPAMIATQEDLADLKLYRVPESVDVAAKSQKQVAFLYREEVEGRLIYAVSCTPWTEGDADGPQPAEMVLTTVNDRRNGLGVALPMGGMTVFEASPDGDQLIGRKALRDYAAGQPVEIAFGSSRQVQASCERQGGASDGEGALQTALSLQLSNANPVPVTVRLSVGGAGEGRVAGLRNLRVKDGVQTVEVSVPANGTRRLAWTYREN